MSKRVFKKYFITLLLTKHITKGFLSQSVFLHKGEKNKFVAIGCNPAIIPEEIFKKVQEEKATRSNIVRNDNLVPNANQHTIVVNSWKRTYCWSLILGYLLCR